MAGSDPRFDADKFRASLRFAMSMAAPSSVPDRATFRWVEEKTFQQHDPANLPYSWTATPVTDVVHPDVQIPVAVAMTGHTVSEEQTDIGDFTPAHAVLTILDQDYAKVQGASMVSLGQHWFDIQFVAPPVGLFEVTIYRVYVSARDASVIP